jgi:hypothetical protein
VRKGSANICKQQFQPLASNSAVSLVLRDPRCERPWPVPGSDVRDPRSALRSFRGEGRLGLSIVQLGDLVARKPQMPFQSDSKTFRDRSP